MLHTHYCLYGVVELGCCWNPGNVALLRIRGFICAKRIGAFICMRFAVHCGSQC